MRRLIADIFKILYERTGLKFWSFVIALTYITALNMITVYGLAMLLTGVASEFKIVLILFRFPLIIGTAVLFLALNYILMLPLEKLSHEKGSRVMMMPLVLYSVFTLILLAYTIYSQYNPLIIP